MLFPISDDNRGISSPALVTWVFLGANILVFLYQLSNPAFTYGWSVVPAEIVNGIDFIEPVLISVGRESLPVPQEPGPTPIYLTLISSMFMHGGWGHIGGNMLYLWIFGDNVEHRFGHVRFIIFYLVSGLVASVAQIATDPQSVIPNLGASGAIAGVLGAYIVLFPHNRVNAIFFYQIISIPALIVLGMWAVTQLISGYGSIAVTEQTGGVAYMAHVGGFVAGVVMGFICRFTMKEEPDSILFRQYRDDDKSRRLW
ncbi:MAG: rhomboid family intramembrane serine protease [Verrucomicrobia bacterium]|nr:rhomboid family intramembrane serine protease [Verrucomicrobiota bacterium]